jgi:hypothetical protein
MASTREEVKIRLGVDGSQVNAGLMSVRQKINKFADDTQRKLASLFRANIYMAAANLLQGLIPTIEEFWEKFYGTDERSMENSKIANDRIRALVKTLKDAKAELEKTIADIAFKNANPEGKIKILTEQADTAKSGQLKNQSEITKWLAFKRDMEAAMGDMFAGSDTQSRIQTAIANLSTEFIKLETKRVELLQKIKEIRDGVKTSQQSPSMELPSPHTNGPLELAPEIANPMFQGLSDYYKKISGQFDAYGSKGEAAKYKAMSDALYDAQTAAIQDNVMPVKIVEIQ